MAAKRITSEELWRFKPTDRIVRQCIAKDTNWLMLADQGRRVYVIDENGKPQWQTQLDFPIHDLAANDQGALFTALLQDGSIVAFGRIGAERWRAQFSRDVTCFNIGRTGSWIAIGLRDQTCALYSSSLQMERKVNVDHRVASVLLLEAAGNDVVLASEVGDISYLNPDGKIVWSHRIRSHTGRVGASANGDIIIIPGYEEGIHTFHRSGEGAGAFDLGQPVILTDCTADGQVMVACTETNRIYVIDRDASILWFKDFTDTVSHMSLNAAGDFLCVGFESSEIVGLALRSGEKKKKRSSSLRIGGLTLESVEKPAMAEETTAVEEGPESTPPEETTPVESALAEEEHPAAVGEHRDAPSQIISSRMDDSETRDEEDAVQELPDEEVVIVEEGDFIEPDKGTSTAEESREMPAAAKAEPAPDRPAREEVPQRRLLWKLDLGDMVKPHHERGLFVSRKGAFIAVVTAGGRMLAFNCRGDKVGEVDFASPAAKLIDHRSEKFVLAWTEKELLKLDIETGKARQFEFGKITPVDVDASDDLRFFGFVHDENRVSVLSEQGKILWRRRNPRKLVSIRISPKASYVVVEDDENRFLVYDAEGKLTRKYRFETTKAFKHLVLEEAYTAFANGHGRIIVLDSAGKQIWTKRVCRRLQNMHSLGDHLGVLDRNGPSLVLDLYGNCVSQFGKLSGLRFLAKPRGKPPMLYHAEQQVLTAFAPPRSHVSWRYHCAEPIKAIAASFKGDLVACVAGSALYCLDGRKVL